MKFTGEELGKILSVLADKITKLEDEERAIRKLMRMVTTGEIPPLAKEKLLKILNWGEDNELTSEKISILQKLEQE